MFTMEGNRSQTCTGSSSMQKGKRIKNIKLVEEELGDLLNEVQIGNILTWQIKFKTPSTRSLNF